MVKKGEVEKDDDDDEELGAPAAKKWRMVQSTSCPGAHYWYNDDTGRSVADPPADFDRAKPRWERKESRSNLFFFFYYNSDKQSRDYPMNHNRLFL